MDPKELRALQEAYLEVVENQQLDELSVNKMLAYEKAAEKNRADLNKKWDKGTATHREKMRVLGREEGEARASDKVEKKTGKRPHQMNKLDKARYAVTKEQVDIYDLILSHLLDEGYADTYEAAEVLMVNMSEDWRESILEDCVDEARITRSMGRRANEYNKNKEQEAHMKRVRDHQEKMKTDSDYRQSHMDASKTHSRVKQVESFNIFVNTMISEGVSLDNYTWEEIQNVFNDIFESQYARENPEKYERDAKRGQSREQQLKSRVTGRLAQMDPEKRKKMEAMMRAQGL
jgi:hypothetical protein